MSTQNIHISGTAYDAANEKLASASSAALAAGKGYFGSLVSDLVHFRALRKAENELRGLDDRMLKDIGLERTEIRSALINARNERVNGWRIPGPPGY